MGMDGVEIRPWQVTDREAMRQLVRDYLEQVANGDGDFVVDDHNVNAMVDLGLSWAEAGEPSLVACVAGEPVGFTLWGPVVSPLHLREKILHGIGTYVAPEQRRNGVSLLIRERAAALAQSLGYDRIDGTAFDQRGWRASSSAGFEVVGYIIRKRLKESQERAA